MQTATVYASAGSIDTGLEIQHLTSSKKLRETLAQTKQIYCHYTKLYIKKKTFTFMLT